MAAVQQAGEDVIVIFVEMTQMAYWVEVRLHENEAFRRRLESPQEWLTAVEAEALVQRYLCKYGSDCLVIRDFLTWREDFPCPAKSVIERAFYRMEGG
jgi:hypothetical protein